jgi:hypothetical protein
VKIGQKRPLPMLDRDRSVTARTAQVERREGLRSSPAEGRQREDHAAEIGRIRPIGFSDSRAGFRGSEVLGMAS